MSTRLRLAFALSLAIGLAAASDPFDGLQFPDGKTRSLEQFHGQTVVVVWFCGHCPNARAFLGKEAKAIHDLIESEQQPATLLLITPDFSATELKTFGKDTGFGLDHALWASDPTNHRDISLNNILQTNVIGPDGGESRTSTSPDALRPLLAKGTCRYPVAGLTDPRVKELWWAVERGYPGALKALKDAAARKGPAQAELTTVLDAVKAATAKRQDELIAAPATFATCEALEAFATESDGLDTKAALARLKELKAAKELKDEFKAREIWQQCQQALASPKPDAQKSAKANLAALAAKMPDTVYGRKAAALK